MKLEVGKLYKTAGGEIVECIAVWSKAVKGFQATGKPIKESRVIDYYINGETGGGDSNDAIVAEYHAPTKTKTVRMAPALYKRYQGFAFTYYIYEDEQEAKKGCGPFFVRWLIDTPYELSVEVPDGPV